MNSAKSKPPPRRSQSRARATPKRWRNGRVSEMRVGILGSALMGGKLGTLFARAGHEVVFSYARTERKLNRLVREAGERARAGTPADTAGESEVLLLAVHWSRVDDVLEQAGRLSGKIIVSCSLPMNANDTELVVAHTSSGASRLRRSCRGVGSSLRSARCRAKCCSACSRPSVRRSDRR